MVEVSTNALFGTFDLAALTSAKTSVRYLQSLQYLEQKHHNEDEKQAGQAAEYKRWTSY